MVSMPSCIFYQLFGECSFIPVMYVVQRLMAPQVRVPPLSLSLSHTHKHTSLPCATDSHGIVVCDCSLDHTAQAFGHLAYNMFNYLFSWGDTYWRHWRKTKYFLFTPRPVSSRLIHHWGEITRTGQLKPYTAKRCACVCDVVFAFVCARVCGCVSECAC